MALVASGNVSIECPDKNQVILLATSCFLNKFIKRVTPILPAKDRCEESALLLASSLPVPKRPDVASKSTESATCTFRFGADETVADVFVVECCTDGGGDASLADTLSFTTSETSGCFQINLPSMPPSTLRHSPDMCPAARCEARNAIAHATSSGLAIFRRGTLSQHILSVQPFGQTKS